MSDGPAGLAVLWPRALVDRLREEGERRAADPEAKAPTRDGMAELDTLRLARFVDAAATLRQELNGVTLKSDGPAVLDGAPARRLVFEVTRPLPAAQKKYVKELTATLQLWLDADGVPLAAESNAKASGRVMLVVSFTTEEKASYRFVRVGDRLVVTRFELTRWGSGAGDKGETKVTFVLTPKVEEAKARALPGSGDGKPSAGL